LCIRVLTVAHGGIDSTVQTVLRPALPGRERQSPGRLSHQALAETQAPWVVDFQHLFICPTQLSKGSAGSWIERIDGAVAEISDEQPIAEPPEVRGRKGEAPRCVQTPTRGEPADQATIGVEYDDEAGMVILAMKSTPRP
jgi:hypothetical protein